MALYAFQAVRASGDAVSATIDAVTQVEAIERVLAHTGGRVSGSRGAAAILDMKPTTLDSRIKKLGARKPPRSRA